MLLNSDKWTPIHFIWTFCNKDNKIINMHLSNSFFLQKNNKVPIKKKNQQYIHSVKHYATRRYLTIYQFKVPLSANYLTISMVVGGSFLFLYLCSFQQHKNYTTYSWPKEKSYVSKRRNSEFDLPAIERCF